MRKVISFTRYPGFLLTLTLLRRHVLFNPVILWEIITAASPMRPRSSQKLFPDITCRIAPVVSLPDYYGIPG
jgi:hypothetical protein